MMGQKNEKNDGLKLFRRKKVTGLTPSMRKNMTGLRLFLRKICIILKESIQNIPQHRYLAAIRNEGLRLFPREKMTGHRLFQERKMTGLLLF